MDVLTSLKERKLKESKEELKSCMFVAVEIIEEVTALGRKGELPDPLLISQIGTVLFHNINRITWTRVDNP